MQSQCRSLRADAGRLDDRPPLLDFGLLQRGERLRRLLLAGNNIVSELLEPLAQRCVAQSFDDGGIEFSNYRRWCSFGRPNRVPHRSMERGQTRFIHCWNVRGRGQACLGGDRIGFDRAPADLRQGGD